MAIESFGDQASGSCFPNPARAREKIGMMKPPMLDSILQRPGQDFLTGYIFESLWAPLTGDYLIRHESGFQMLDVRGQCEWLTSSL